SQDASHTKGRLPGIPVQDEIILFRFRKRLLIGTCQAVLPRKISEITVLSEDGRRLRFRHTNLVYLTGTSDVPLKTYATAVRALSREIDLEAVWEIAVESATPLPLSEIADLFYNTEIDATQWIALYLHLHHASPYFQPQSSNSYSPYTAGQVHVLHQRDKLRKDRDEEREEFIHAMANPDDSIAEHTLTPRQQTYLEQIRQYALWGSESQHATHAQALISEICKTKKTRQKSAVELLIKKKVWKRDQNLDLLRAEVPTAFSDLAIRQAETLAPTCGNLKKQPVFVIHPPDHPNIALSYRRRFFGGAEFGVHIPDIGALIPKNSHIDRDAAERMAHIPFPDQPVPMLPTRFSHDLGQFQSDKAHPALSIFWRVNRNNRIKDFCIAQTATINKADLSPENIDHALNDPAHPQHRAIQFFSQLSARLLKKRQTAIHSLEEQSPPNHAYHIARELSLLAGIAVGRWCENKGIPAIYETRDPIENTESIVQISHPIVRHHELHRQTPNIGLNTTPETHHGYGISHYCPITQPTARYTDLVMQRQINHYLKTEQSLYTVDDLNTLRYRMWETLALIDDLVHRRTRDLILQKWENQIGREFRAVVLHLKMRGVLV
ncbi:MAG: RNB domain-containing ribonuclease, partial [Gemmatimonadetes bacterium]|nr:RNB domain-containing ribonuclease [Gemmatimonadota bacterium]